MVLLIRFEPAEFRCLNWKPPRGVAGSHRRLVISGVISLNHVFSLFWTPFPLLLGYITSSSINSDRSKLLWFWSQVLWLKLKLHNKSTNAWIWGKVAESFSEPFSQASERSWLLEFLRRFIIHIFDLWERERFSEPVTLMLVKRTDEYDLLRFLMSSKVWGIFNRISSTGVDFFFWIRWGRNLSKIVLFYIIMLLENALNHW